ncbi:M20 family metallopeptidase [Nonomuraea soli]|uniref:Acetylornithine deacetylase/succinyl-diaminopimelate desuccinylase-like protein n=1 Tax=Nonomuraea soli TaxID=1032476 RepID=A0A7W0CFM6_9ACTN|nr:M20/M25/M40 family metallo-hydrolase [Nonomuraea soli]MBA2890132.1 acetylornithine deacetylase/succinyl-diaminopimelate desuccinylase-like protein [Nonomuraea soli]
MTVIGTDRLRELVAGLVRIPSPTGDERALAEHIAAELGGRVQPLGERQANAVARLRGDGTGPDLMLYAPIDTMTAVDERDLPPEGPEPAPEIEGDLVTGPGAGNPKGHAACVMAAFETIRDSGVRLKGDVIAAFGAGGMPDRGGQGVGCSFLLEQGYHPDYAVIAKPGWSASHEEVGLAWFEVTVRGHHTYVGSRHRLPYDNAIASAAEVVLAIETWAEDYTVRHTSGQVAPQAIVGAIEGGWWRMPAFTPAACRFLVDVRLSPRDTPAQVKREFLTLVHGLGAEAEMVLSIPGTSTDPGSPVVRAAVGAFERLDGHHVPQEGMSGATDANILRSRGVPTVRVGMPKVAGITDFALGMNTVDVREMARLTELLVMIASEVAG